MEPGEDLPKGSEQFNSPGKVSERFLDKLLSGFDRFPVESTMTAVAVGQMVGAAISFSSGNKDAAYTQALAATITQVTTLGVLSADIAIRKHFRR